MKKTVMIIISLMCIHFAFAAGGGIALAFTPSTGDKVLDSRLDAINSYAAKDQNAFVAKLSATYHVSQTEIEGMLQQGMTPADVYMSLRVAKITNKTPDQVEKGFLHNPGKGWGVIAKSLGIKPGSKDFKSLKDGASTFSGDDNAGEKAKNKEKGMTGKGSDKSGNAGHGNGHGGGDGNGGHGGGKGK
jgi:hypothetical protein